MKIAIIGAHGTGKTFLCNEIFKDFSQKGFKVKVIKEGSRLCPLPINEATTRDAQTWILMNQIASEIEAIYKKFDLIVCDRGVIDNYAYFVHKFGEQKELSDLVEKWTKTYNFTFKMPYSTKYLIEDGLRSTNLFFHQAIEKQILELLKQKKISFFELPRKNRLEFIKEKIKLKEKQHHSL